MSKKRKNKEKESVLPKWLVERGFQAHWDLLSTLADLKEELKWSEDELKKLKAAYKSLKAKAGKKEAKILKETFQRRINLETNRIKSSKDEIRRFKAEFFAAEDVERAMKEAKNQVKQ